MPQVLYINEPPSQQEENRAYRWRKLSGEDGWDGLLYPLDLDLRRYIIHYGQRAGSVGDLFNYNRHGQLPKEKFFQEAGLVKGNEFKYDVSHYIYAGSEVVNPAWFGFVAVTTDDGKRVLGRRDTLIAWRGTITFSERLNNLNSAQQSAEQLFGTESEATVHSGFLSFYTGTRSDSIDVKKSARHQMQVREALKELLTKYKDEEVSITVTGFSLGGALATLNAMDIVANGFNKARSNHSPPCMVQPSHTVLLASDTMVWRNYPENWIIFKFYALKTPRTSCQKCRAYTDTEEVGIIEERSWVNDFFSAHNMDVYVHAIAGEQEGDKFHLEVDIDYKLVNKHLDRLKVEYGVPTYWWDGENRKRMEQEDHSGHWKVKRDLNI
ncbi:hypothetical protein F3Y22_tig00110393pilonHSYRG00094 [Hibiscus syriacus]|uniref:Phospholipase A1 n=1 Tax=Hibiscus syriacus TaxID=106335 RepID=A0A6A3ARI0_HIBSY|nr:hypothetical protein F3Y22_tig00110393pilonHSYRG00094 [Hibiscus syriacus]